jgi:hypothetical protein
VSGALNRPVGPDQLRRPDPGLRQTRQARRQRDESDVRACARPRQRPRPGEGSPCAQRGLVRNLALPGGRACRDRGCSTPDAARSRGCSFQAKAATGRTGAAVVLLSRRMDRAVSPSDAGQGPCTWHMHCGAADADCCLAETPGSSNDCSLAVAERHSGSMLVAPSGAVRGRRLVTCRADPAASRTPRRRCW